MSIEVLIRELIDSINTLNETMKNTTSSVASEEKPEAAVETPKKAKTPSRRKAAEKPDVDYEQLRKEVRELAAEKASTDRATVKKVIGSVQDGVDKLADISDEYLQSLKEKLEEL